MIHYFQKNMMITNILKINNNIIINVIHIKFQIAQDYKMITINIY